MINNSTSISADIAALVAAIAVAPFRPGLNLVVTAEDPSLPVDWRSAVVSVEARTAEEGAIDVVLTVDNDLKLGCSDTMRVAEVARRMLAGEACEDERDSLRIAAALAASKFEHLDGRSALKAIKSLPSYLQRAAHAAELLLARGDRD